MCDVLLAMPDATRRGSVLFGKNSDRPVDDCQVLHSSSGRDAGPRVRCSYVRVRDSEPTLATLGCRPYWCWGYETGVNEAGVVGGNTAIYTRELRARGRTVVLGAGKAAAAMARAVDEHWAGPLSGLVVTPYGHSGRCNRIQVLEAEHPGCRAATRILELASSLEEQDLAICLMSGGGSAVLALPAPGVSLETKRALNNLLLRSGVKISEVNCVRKRLSMVKGGRPAAACWPARVVTLIISDSPEDDPSVVASGPTVPDPTSVEEVQQVLATYNIDTPPEITAHFAAPDCETPKPGDDRMTTSRASIVATARDALAGAAAAARAAGVVPVIVGDRIEGEARRVAREHAQLVSEHARRCSPDPCVLLSGGETTVTVRGRGRGGRNSEFALALANALEGCPGVYSIACDTDGIDGTDDNAGAVISPDTLSRASALDLDPDEHLANNDAYGFLFALGDLMITGPALTNVNDFRAMLLHSPSCELQDQKGKE